ncbi:MAG: acyl-CoA thioesterase II [Actinobacteria bacterium]|nr:acyl-CoA thioesterase II [Actinomycetota bacterium]
MPSPEVAVRGCDHVGVQADVDALIALLDLEPIEVNIFRGVSPDEKLQRVFGGQVAGQGLVAAARTVDRPDMHVHSLHAYFLRPGDPSVPILYEVDRIRDGRSFATRRVVAIQHGRAIFNLAASFHVAEPGLDHQLPAPSGVPEPETLPDFRQRWEPWAGSLGEWYHRPRPIDTRVVDWRDPGHSEPQAPRQLQWIRADGVLPDDPLLHICVVTYASDMTLLDTVKLPHGGAGLRTELQMASLDHAMWFHRPFRADEWLLYDLDTPSASSALGLARGLFFDRAGTLVASVVQEGLLRPVQPA